jgi:hypothetical protein
MYFSITLILIVLFHLSCKKEMNCTQITEPIICVSDTFPCENLPSQNMGSYWIHSYDSLLYTLPHFLPRSNNEFYVIKQNSTFQNEFDLIAHNIYTKKSTIISTNTPTSEAVAVNDDFIIYNSFADGMLHKIDLKSGNSNPINIYLTSHPVFLANKTHLSITVGSNGDDNYIIDDV